MTRRTKKWGIIALVVVTLGLVWRSGFGGAEGEASVPVFEVRQGPLTISVTESGTIQSRERVTVSSELEGRTTLLWLIEEGQIVEKGDLLVELDSSGLEDQQVDQQIRVMNAEAAYIRAREQLEIIRNQAEADIARAKLDFRFAELNRTKYIEGDFPQEMQRAEAEIHLAEEELQRANDKLEWSQRLAEEGYVTRMELQADELAGQRAAIDLELAQGKLRLLEEYTHQQRLEELESDVDQTRLALERVQRRAAADIVQAEADYRARASEHERQVDRLQRIEDQIVRCRIYAPASGMVVYTTTGQGRRGNEEPLRAGQEVRERQELIYLPTAAAMMAQVSIHESSLRKISTGLPAIIRVDALPNQTFHGTVRRIALLPDAQHGWLNPDLKVYPTDIHIDGEASELRPGMNSRAEIIIDQLEDAIHVPLQAVVRTGTEAFVYVLTQRGNVPRPVETGQDNNRMIHILSGLEAGERVLLNPPLEGS